MNLRYTLLADGTSDRSLVPIIDWAVKQNARAFQIETIDSQWADLGFLYKKLGPLAERVRKAVEVYPCDLLFVHRDAEADSREQRLDEIRNAISLAQFTLQPHYVPVVPVRMTEAWLLGSEAAIRTAAGNPSGVIDLDLPKLATVERLLNPKELLFEKLKLASGLGARRRERFRVEEARTQISQRTDDFAYLKALSSFQEFQRLLEASLQALAENERRPATPGKRA